MAAGVVVDGWLGAAIRQRCSSLPSMATVVGGCRWCFWVYEELDWAPVRRCGVGYGSQGCGRRVGVEGAVKAVVKERTAHQKPKPLGASSLRALNCWPRNGITLEAGALAMLLQLPRNMTCASTCSYMYTPATNSAAFCCSSSTTFVTTLRAFSHCQDHLLSPPAGISIAAAMADEDLATINTSRTAICFSYHQPHPSAAYR